MKSSYNVLVVDDNQDDRELIKQHFCEVTEKSYLTLETPSNSGVLDLIKKHQPHCILLGYSLPNENWIDALHNIIDSYPFVPVIVFSDEGNESIVAESIKKGAYHYLVKSEITPALLNYTVTQGIEKKKLEKVLFEKNQEIEQHRKKSVEQKQRYDRVVRAANIIVWEYNINEDQLYIEDEALKLTGVPLNDNRLSLEQWRSYIHKDDLASVKEYWTSFLKHPDNEYDLHYRVRHKNSAYRWVRETGSVTLKDEHGNPIQLAGLYEDISERKSSELILNQLYNLTVKDDIVFEQKISEILKLVLTYFDLDLGVISKTTAGQHEIIYSELSNSQTVASSTELLSELNSYFFYIHGKKDINFWHNANSCDMPLNILNGKPLIETFISTTIYVEDKPFGTLSFIKKTPREVPFSDKEKMIFQFVVQWITSDLSRKKYIDDVQESKRFLEFVLDAIPDLIFVKDNSFRIVRGNPAFMNVYPEEVRDSIIGTTTVESYEEKEAEAFLANDRLALKNGHSETEEKIAFPDGITRVLHTKKTRFYDNEHNRFILGVGRDITAIRRAENQRRAIHEAMENTVEGISQLDLKGFYTYVNDAYASLCGYESDELIGKHWTITVDEAEHEAMNAAYQEMLETGKIVRETRGKRKDGNLFYKRVTMLCHYDSDGKLVGHHCFMNDISGRKQSEAYLAESKERYELAVTGSSVGLWDWNVKTGDLFWSDRFKEIMGIADEDFRPEYEEFSDRLHPEDKEKTETALFGHIENRTRYDVEYRLRRTDGSYVWIHARGQAIWDEEGNATRMAGSVDDISERKLAEASLEESKEQYELAVKGSSVGLWDWNVKTGDLFWSDRFKEIVGIADEDFRPQYEEFSDRLHPDDKEKTEAALFGHVENRTPYDVEYRLKRDDGSYVWIHARGQAIWDKEGNATRMAGSVDDISISKAAQDEVLRSNLELERFAYVASHDLQEPLRMVTNFTQLLKKQYEDKLDDRAQEYIQYAHNGASRMQQLVQGLLEYARLDNAADDSVQIDLNDLKTSIEENLTSAIKQTGAVIEWPQLPVVKANPVHIRSVFQNLIGNAIKYRKPDIKPHIKISVEPISGAWQFSISDNGIGMKQEYCEKIFEPFKRLHRKEEYSGTGMGLSICRKTVEGLGGKIWATSTLEQGSNFYIHLPKTSTNKSRGEPL